MKQLTEIEEGNKPGNPTHLLIPIKDIEEYFGSVSDLFFKDMVNAKQISLNENDIEEGAKQKYGRKSIYAQEQQRAAYKQALKDLLK